MRTGCHTLSTGTGAPQGEANTHGQRARDASQMVRGPVFVSGSTARSPCTCSHWSPSASDLRADVELEAYRRDNDRAIRFRAAERPTERRELVVRELVRFEAVLRRRSPLQGLESSGSSPSASTCTIIDDSPASARFADPARVTKRSSNQLRTSFADTASTRQLPKARARASVILILFAMFRSLPPISIATGATWAAHRCGTPKTRRGPASHSKFGRAALSRRAGCQPLLQLCI